MNPINFFPNKTSYRTYKKKNKDDIFTKDVLFTRDTHPGYWKNGYEFVIDSVFTGWDTEQQNNTQKNERSKSEDKGTIKTIFKDFIFDGEITLKNAFIKKIKYMPNFRLADTKKYFESKKNEKSDLHDKYKEFDYYISDNESDSQENEIKSPKNFNNDSNNLNNQLTANIERPLMEEHLLTEEESKNFYYKLKEIKNNPQKSTLQLIKEIRQKKEKEKEDNKNENIIETSNKKSKDIIDIENNELQFMTPNDQNDLLMFFIPDQFPMASTITCSSCNMKGHSKEQCVQFPDPNYDKNLKHCMNCGCYGHLYCRKNIKKTQKPENEVNDESEEEEESEEDIWKKYYFDFDLKDDNNSEEEKLQYEIGNTKDILTNTGYGDLNEYTDLNSMF